MNDFKNLTKVMSGFLQAKKNVLIPIKVDFSLNALLKWVGKNKDQCVDTVQLVDCILSSKLLLPKMNGKSVLNVYQDYEENQH